jgi:hypothetical protein|tara:strand:+ start:995 stop:1153 length:159 start_codon:yes stop_codon:yes gene_type:complete
MLELKEVLNESKFSLGDIDLKYFMKLLKNHPILSIVNNMLIDLPVPANISYF